MFSFIWSNKCLWLIFRFYSFLPERRGANLRKTRNHVGQEGQDGVHEEVQRPQMGDLLQVLRGLSEVPSDPEGDGAFPQALVLGGLGQRLRLQRLVHSKTDPEQSGSSSSSSSSSSFLLRGQAEAPGPKAEGASWRGRGGNGRSAACGGPTDWRWGRWAAGEPAVLTVLRLIPSHG